MSVRLFPDIIVMSEVKESLDDVILICKNNNDFALSKGITTVYVSAERCAKRQHSYAKRGLGNVFLGFNGKEWTVDDFEYYFADSPQIFKRVIGTKHKYAVELGDIFEDVSNLEEAKDRINEFCLSLLTQETYNPRVLEKFGVIA